MLSPLDPENNSAGLQVPPFRHGLGAQKSTVVVLMVCVVWVLVIVVVEDTVVVVNVTASSGPSSEPDCKPDAEPEPSTGVIEVSVVEVVVVFVPVVEVVEDTLVAVEDMPPSQTQQASCGPRPSTEYCGRLETTQCCFCQTFDTAGPAVNQRSQLPVSVSKLS